MSKGITLVAVQKMALNRVAEPVKEESMWKGRAFAEVLRAVLVIVMVAGLGVGSAAGKGRKPPKEPVTPFQVEYGTDPIPLQHLSGW